MSFTIERHSGHGLDSERIIHTKVNVITSLGAMKGDVLIIHTQ